MVIQYNNAFRGYYNVGLDKLLDLCEIYNQNYEQEEVLDFLVFMDNLDFEIAEDMISGNN